VLQELTPPSPKLRVVPIAELGSIQMQVQPVVWTAPEARKVRQEPVFARTVLLENTITKLRKFTAQLAKLEEQLPPLGPLLAVFVFLANTNQRLVLPHVDHAQLVNTSPGIKSLHALNVLWGSMQHPLEL
jgi:hypothetical protein